MIKFIKDFWREPKYFFDKLSGRSKIGCTDHSYFTTNGRVIKAFYNLKYLYFSLFFNRILLTDKLLYFHYKYLSITNKHH